MIKVTEEQMLLLRTYRRRVIPMAILLLFVAALDVWVIFMPVDFLSRSGDSIRRVLAAKSGAVCIAFLGYGYLLHAFRIVFGACLDLRRQALVQETGIVASAFARTNIKITYRHFRKRTDYQYTLVVVEKQPERLFCDSLKKARSLTWTLHILSHTGLWMTRGYLVDDSVCNWAARRKMLELSKAQHRQYTFIAAKYSRIVFSCCAADKVSAGDHKTGCVKRK